MHNETLLSPFFLDQSAPLLERFARSTWAINKPYLQGSGTLDRMAAYHEPIANFVAAAAGANHRPISIAGDCCQGIPVLAGLQRAGLDPVLLWLDSHGDFNTVETSPSGAWYGMPLAMIVGRGVQKLPHALRLKAFPEDQVIVCDGRNLDPLEGEALRASDVALVGAVESVPALLRGRDVYVHFDADVLDPQDAPSMAYSEPGGPRLDAVIAAMRLIADENRIVAVSMTTWDFAKDTDKRSQKASMRVVEALVGGI